ncbi:MAG: D-2-hydroxyacid dehydrogenase [Chloroflexi bacterium]|nr:D-2-hydroxyacid dehydrogenase [Chloroflexota bacterium]
MTVLLASRAFFQRYDAELERISTTSGPRGPIERVEVPEDEVGRLSPEDMERITVAFSSGDLQDRPELGLSRRLYGAARRAPNLEWLHVSNVGTDDPIYAELIAKGAAVSNSPGSNAEPIAVTTLGAMLSLARNLPAYAEAQRAHEWRKLRRTESPADLRGQTVTIVGLGTIGGYLAAFLRPLGVHIIGVRRRPAGAEDGVDEWVSPDRLAEVLPRTQWLILATPLTSQTRGLIDARALALLPSGAHVLNVGRGPVMDEDALVEAIRSGHIAGAYLDVFAQEPLPADSPLWDLPNVILTPHDSSVSLGNTPRADEIFLEELERWQRGEQPLRAVAVE